MGTVLVTAGRAGAQQAPRSAGAITGVVFDSLDDKPLGAASVFLIGTPLAVTTNAQGRFAFDSVPAGAYRVAFESADLDAIGLTPNPQSVAVRAGVTDTIALFVPSVTTLLDAMCPASRAAGGESILLGSVSDAATGAPVASATVTVSWQDVSVERKKVVEQHHVVPATTAADGSYAVCGIPGDVLVMVRAAAGRRASGVTWVLVAPRRLVRKDVAVALDGRTARLTGVVADTAGHPLAGAQIQVVGVPGGANTDEQGRFQMATLPAGSWDVEVHRIGFWPNRFSVVLHPDQTTTATFTLGAATNTLDTVRVQMRRPDAFALQEKARAYPGATFFSKAAIDSLHATQVTDILRHARGVQLVVPDSGGPPLVQMLRSRFSDIDHAGICPVEYYVDGVPFDMQNSPDAYFHPGDIAAIEVYDGASTIPPEYKAGSSSCGVVVIWTKRAGS
ncbi:MAG TPA: carboxypeptidase regulatory-like domain-containing protein [Gemmatimonadaceae bacterium]